MKKYTFQFLIVTLATALLGFTGLEFPGDTAVRLLCLFAFIALLVSCLDAVIVSHKSRQNAKKSRAESSN
jgi:uncharacterized membrane protein YtjA (UPF0391 family)